VTPAAREGEGDRGGVAAAAAAEGPARWGRGMGQLGKL